jgi:hypothetical protein
VEAVEEVEQMKISVEEVEEVEECGVVRINYQPLLILHFKW